MKRILALFLATALAGTLVGVGCESKPVEKTGGQTIASGPKICAKCGQIKGSALCCKPGATICSKCGLAKGSPGCCKLPKDTKQDVLLCAKCGQIKGSDLCCKSGATICPKCGLAKGSPGCCKINKIK